MYQVTEYPKSFCLPNQKGETVCLNDFKGKYVIIYFYPKDMTPGCTTQACAFRDLNDEYKNENAVILGISKDHTDSHLKFADKYQLPFNLLSDETLDVCKQFGVYGEKKLYGRPYMGIHRTTFLLDQEGKIIRIFEKASPSKNAKEILQILKGVK